MIFKNFADQDWTRIEKFVSPLICDEGFVFLLVFQIRVYSKHLELGFSVSVSG